MAIWEPGRRAKDDPLRPVTLERFGGLNLRDAPQEVGWSGAIDLLNVDLDETGRVRQRDGYGKFSLSAAADRYQSLHASGRTIFGARSTGVIDAGIGSGSLSSSSAIAATPTGNVSFANIGSTSTNYTYASAANGIAGWRRYDHAAATWSTPATMPAVSGLIAVQPTDNRLVHGDVAGSRVRFSDAGAPETWGANNYVDLTPGDGETITGVTAWQNLLFVFKPSTFYVFYGNSTDGSGNPVFNYRTVSGIGAGLGETRSGIICAAQDGVYFVGREGVYVTTGGTPRLISSALDKAIGRAASGSLPVLATYASHQSQMVYFDRRLYITIGAGLSPTTRRMLVYDTSTDTWLWWDIQANALAVYRGITVDDAVVFSYATGTNDVGEIGSSYTTDDGTVIDSYYCTGYSDLGTPMSEKIVHAWQLDGIGSVGVKIASSDGSLGSAATATLGTSPANANGFRPGRGWKGRNFSVQLEDVSGGAWTVDRLTAHVRGERPPESDST